MHPPCPCALDCGLPALLSAGDTCTCRHIRRDCRAPRDVRRLWVRNARSGCLRPLWPAAPHRPRHARAGRSAARRPWQRARGLEPQNVWAMVGCDALPRRAPVGAPPRWGGLHRHRQPDLGSVNRAPLIRPHSLTAVQVGMSHFVVASLQLSLALMRSSTSRVTLDVSKPPR